MPCCRGQNYDRVFDARTARRELARYRRKGVRGASRKLLEMVNAISPFPRTVLDIGGGIGALQHELAAAGASSITAVDAAAAYLEAARAEAERRGDGCGRTYVEGDFVALAPRIAPAELVTLDKVICCYPDMPALVAASAAKALRLYAIVVPRDRWWIRWGSRLSNWVLRLLGFPFRSFVHPLWAIDREASRQGLSLARWQDRLVWTVRLYWRVGRASD